MLSSGYEKSFGLIIGLLLLICLFFSSIIFGLTDISWQMVIDAYTNFDGSNEQLIIKTARVPRALIATAVGASLAVAGALMQGLTRNPLASPGILGVNAGAGFFVVAAVSFFSISSLTLFTWVSFLGAAFAAVLVYLLGSLGREGLTPLKLTLAGAALAALFSSLTQGMLLINEKAMEEVLYWLAGSVEGRKLEYLFVVLPYLAIGWVMALWIAKHMNILIMGDDMARGLGQKVVLIKILCITIIVLLAGGSVAVAGPIGFIGLVVPHISRTLVGPDYRWLIPYCAVLGGVLLLVADIAARYVIMPEEVPVGAMTALIGAPFFIYIARRGFKS